MRVRREDITVDTDAILEHAQQVTVVVVKREDVGNGFAMFCDYQTFFWKGF